jgi:hypothetical protein
VNSRNFFSELKRRNVYKVAIAYAVVAWLLLQAASILFPTFEAPPWTMKVFVVVTALGFPIALIIAWAFELTPEGLKRTEFADELPKKSARNRAWIYVVVIAGAISIGLALKEAGRASALKPRAEHAAYGPGLEENLALIRTIIGENSGAISTLARLLEIPYKSPLYGTPITPALLRLDPMWDPLRADPAFRKLCEEKPH